MSYYVINYRYCHVDQLPSLDDYLADYSCDTYNMIPLKYGKWLILGRSHKSDARHINTYFVGITKNLTDANSVVADLLNEANNKVQVFCSYAEAVNSLKALIEPCKSDDPEPDDLEAIAYYEDLLRQLSDLKQYDNIDL